MASPASDTSPPSLQSAGSGCAVCGRAASLSCSSCGSVRYCAKEHQRSHWAQHKQHCSAYKILANDKLGRYMVAARNLRAGDVVFRERAVVSGPKMGAAPLCLGCCGRVDGGSPRCPRCSYPFCAASCYQSAAHAGECAVLSRSKFRVKIADYEAAHGAYDCVTPLRCLLAREADPDGYRRLMTLQDHNEARRGSEVWDVIQVNIVDFLRGACQLGDQFDAEHVHSVCGILEVNAFEVRVGRARLRAVYPLAAMMAHSCVVNTNHSIDEKRFEMTVRASVPIAKGQPIFLSYANTLQGTKERREHLRQNKFFECDCARCADAAELGTFVSAVRCRRCPTGAVVLERPLDQHSAWRCTSCPYRLTAAVMDKTINQLRRELDDIDASDVAGFERFVERHTPLLHANHWMLTSALHSLSQLYGRIQGYLINDLTTEQLRRKVEICQSLLAVADVLEPGMTRFRGVTLYELHAPMSLLLKNEFQAGRVDAAEFQERARHICQILEEVVLILKVEDPASPEGIMAKAAEAAHMQVLRWVAAV